MNIVVAVIGAFLAGYFLTPVFGVGTINNAITFPTMLIDFVGISYSACDSSLYSPPQITIHHQNEQLALWS